MPFGFEIPSLIILVWYVTYDVVYEYLILKSVNKIKLSKLRVLLNISSKL